MQTPTNRIKKKINWKETLYGYMFLAPALIFFGYFVVYPMIKGIYLSLFRFRGRNQVFVGFQHYERLFQDEVFLKSVFNTIFITAVAVPIVVVFSLFVAMTIYEKNAKVRSFFRGVFYIPAISSVVSVTVVWAWIYHPRYGILNYVLNAMNVSSGAIDWLGSNTSYLL